MCFQITHFTGVIKRNKATFFNLPSKKCFISTKKLALYFFYKSCVCRDFLISRMNMSRKVSETEGTNMKIWFIRRQGDTTDFLTINTKQKSTSKFQEWRSLHMHVPWKYDEVGVRRCHWHAYLCASGNGNNWIKELAKPRNTLRYIKWIFMLFS